MWAIQTTVRIHIDKASALCIACAVCVHGYNCFRIRAAEDTVWRRSSPIELPNREAKPPKSYELKPVDRP